MHLSQAVVVQVEVQKCDCNQKNKKGKNAQTYRICNDM